MTGEGLIRDEFLTEFKIESKIFDKRTLFAIFKLIKKGIIKSVEGVVKEGKESVVVSARTKVGDWLSLKIYRVEYTDFKSMWKYLAGDPRFDHVRKNKRSVVLTWAKREFKNLKIAFDNEVCCPKPIALNENVLVTEFIGENGKQAPRLIDVKFEDSQEVYDLIIEEMKKLAKANLIHTDLSPYNILVFNKPYLIDFSQAVTEKHPSAEEFLQRDVQNINSYFRKLNVKTDENLFDELKKLMKL